MDHTINNTIFGIILIATSIGLFVGVLIGMRRGYTGGGGRSGPKVFRNKQPEAFWGSIIALAVAAFLFALVGTFTVLHPLDGIAASKSYSATR